MRFEVQEGTVSCLNKLEFQGIKLTGGLGDDVLDEIYKPDDPALC